MDDPNECPNSELCQNKAAKTWLYETRLPPRRHSPNSDSRTSLQITSPSRASARQFYTEHQGTLIWANDLWDHNGPHFGSDHQAPSAPKSQIKPIRTWLSQITQGTLAKSSQS